MLTQSRYRFGEFELRVNTRQLLRNDAPVALRGRAFDLLVCLVENHHRTVPKDELLEAIWPRTVVIENNLNAQVRSLRKALGTSAVVTVSGLGFRIGFEVRGEPDRTSAIRPLPQDLPAIAVLAFRNLTGNPAEDYFADGMAEEILTTLSHFKQFRVIARNSAFAYRAVQPDVRQIGQELGVRYVLKASVRRSAGRLRINARLMETLQGSQLWSARWDRALEDMFDLQDEIAARVALSIEPAIRRAEVDHARRKRPESLAAHDLVLQALPHLYAMRPHDNSVAQSLLEKALALEPGYAWAQAHAAWCHEQALSRGWPGSNDAQRAAAVWLARQALAAAGDDAVIVGLAGFVLFAVAKDTDCGLAALRRATALNPNAALVANLAGTANLFAGNLVQAAEQLERVLRLSPADPASFMFVSALACVRLLLDEPHAALGLCADSAAANPNWDFTWWVTAAAAGEAKDADRAEEAFQNLLRIGPDRTLAFPGFRIFRDDIRRERLLSGLRKAGLRDGQACRDPQ